MQRLRSQRAPQTGRLVPEEEKAEDRAARSDAPRTQVVVLPSDYAQEGNQSTSSFRQEDHGWQGGGWIGGGLWEGTGGGHKGWQILLSRAEGANSRALTGWCKATLGGKGKLNGRHREAEHKGNKRKEEGRERCRGMKGDRGERQKGQKKQTKTKHLTAVAIFYLFIIFCAVSSMSLLRRLLTINTNNNNLCWSYQNWNMNEWVTQSQKMFTHSWNDVVIVYCLIYSVIFHCNILKYMMIECIIFILLYNINVSCILIETCSGGKHRTQCRVWIMTDGNDFPSKSSTCRLAFAKLCQIQEAVFSGRERSLIKLQHYSLALLCLGKKRTCCVRAQVRAHM